tara:strand:+ start:394 stop:852 length:459 start_codon:yes stop_codon:yes gene_type:complete
MEMDDLPLVAKKYSSYYGTDEQKHSHLLARVCRQQLGLVLEWCTEQGVECFEDTHRHTIVQKHLAVPLNLVDDFRKAKDDFFESVGVTNIDEMNEFSQDWDGFNVESMSELVLKVDRIDDLVNAQRTIADHLDTAEDSFDKAIILARVKCNV